MAASFEDHAFVLQRHAWKESSFVLRVLTREHGRLSVVARGMRGGRRKHAVLPGQRSLLHWSGGRELGRLHSLDILPPPVSMLSGEAYFAAQYLAEVLLQVLPEAEPVPAIFDLYAASLDALHVQSGALAAPLRSFEFGLLQALGHGFSAQTDRDGNPVRADLAYSLMPEQGLYTDPRGGFSGAVWLALARGSLSEEDAHQLRRPLQAQLGSMLDLGRLRSREQWLAARRLREEHQQYARGNQPGTEQLSSVEGVTQEPPSKEHDPQRG